MAAAWSSLTAHGRRCAQSRPLVDRGSGDGAGRQHPVRGRRRLSRRTSFYPASGLTGNLWRIGTFGFSFGVSSIAEIQLDGGVRNRLTITTIDARRRCRACSTVTGDDARATSRISTHRREGSVRVGDRRRGRRWRCGSGRGCRTPATRAASASTRPTFTSASRSARPCSRCASSATSASASWPIRFAATAERRAQLRRLDRARGATGVEIVGEINGRLNTRSGDAADRHREPIGDAPRRAVHARRRSASTAR